MSEHAKRLREERATTWNEMTSIMDAAERDGRELSAEEREKWDRGEARLGELEGDIERIERSERLEAAAATAVPTNDDPTLRNRPAGSGQTDEQAYARAFGNFLRRGLTDMDPEERKLVQSSFRGETRAQGDTPTSAGGYLVPQGYWQRISEVMKAYGGIQQHANIIRTGSGQVLPWPNNDDTANAGRWLAENTQVTETDLTVGQRELQAWTLSSDIVRVSLQLLEDSAFDLDTWVPQKLGTRLGRGTAAALANGTGTGQPTGIVPNVRTGVTGATGVAGAFTYDNLVDLVHSVDPAYRDSGRATFFFADTTLGAIRKLKDNYGHPLWQPNVQAGSPDFLLGYPIQIDQAIPAPALSAKSILFGDMHDGYVLRQVADVRMMRLTERYADYLQVGIMAFLRQDGMPDDPNALAAFAGAAT